MRKDMRMESVTCSDVLTFAHSRQDEGDFGCCEFSPGKGVLRCGYCCGPLGVKKGASGLTLMWVDICPACVLSGPKHVATLSMHLAGDVRKISALYGHDCSKSGKADAASMGIEYRKIAKKCRSLASFEDLLGGVVAVAIAKSYQGSIVPGIVEQAGARRPLRLRVQVVELANRIEGRPVAALRSSPACNQSKKISQGT